MIRGMIRYSRSAVGFLQNFLAPMRIPRILMASLMDRNSSRIVGANRKITETGIVIFLLFIAAGQLTLIPLLLGVSVFGALLSHASKQCDRLLVSYPRMMPGGEEPRELSWEDVDAPSLPAWCDARRRERHWNLAAIVFLVEFVVAVLAIFASVMLNQTAFSAGSSSQDAHTHALIWNSVLALVAIAAALATVAIGRLWTRKKDSELRHQAGLV